MGPAVHGASGRARGGPHAGGTRHGGAVNGVEIISSLPAARGRRVGEAVTRAPTLVRPDLPAALFASDLGRPVYERMGFVTVLRFALWVGA